jgi:hypothetical protein
MDTLPVRPVEEFAETNKTRGGRKNRKALSNLREQIDPLMCQAYKDAQAEANWATITANTPDMESNGPNGHSGTYLAGAVKQWATPCSRDHHPNGQAEGSKTDLGNQVAQWGTPTARDHKSGRGNEEREYKELTPMVERTQSGKLNPRWVETLMGLPVGWVMPSCQYPITPQGDASQEFQLSTTGNWPTASTMDVITPTRDLTQMESKGHWGKQPRQRPDGIGFIAPNTGKLSEMVHYTSPVTIEQTNCDSSATESCLPPPSEHLELF